MKRAVISIVACCLAAAAVLTGCDSEKKGKFDVDVFWQIGGDNTCQVVLGSTGDLLEFDEVVISVYKTESSETTIQVASVPCTDFSYTIPRLTRGKYFVKVDAMADYDGEHLAYYQASQTIKSPSNSEYADGYKFALEKGRADVTVKWGFDNSLWCGSNGVEDMDISIADGLVPCDDESYLLEDVPWDFYVINVEGLDADGVPVMSGQYNDGLPYEIKPGKDYDLMVVLSSI